MHNQKQLITGSVDFRYSMYFTRDVPDSGIKIELKGILNETDSFKLEKQSLKSSYTGVQPGLTWKNGLSLKNQELFFRNQMIVTGNLEEIDPCGKAFPFNRKGTAVIPFAG